MTEFRQRRSCRLAVSIPLRVFGTDYRGRDFSEDTTTLVVNLHGAKIRLSHQLLPEQEIRLLSHPTRREALFRVVSKVGGEEGLYSFWGVESLNPEENIWGLQFPQLETPDQDSVRVMVQCPACSTRELLHLDEPLLQTLASTDGIMRGCLVCQTSRLWKLIPHQKVQ
jgi:hypothetical protein